MARAARVTLFEREVRVTLGAAALDLLLGGAKVLSEGERAQGTFFGSTMLTIDLASATGRVRECCDAATAARVADLIRDDARVLRRVRALAEKEAARLAGGRLELRAVETRVRSEGAVVYVDVDYEGTARSLAG